MIPHFLEQPLFYQHFPFHGKILNLPFLRKFRKFILPQKLWEAVLATISFSDWRVQSRKPGSNNILTNEVQDFGSYQGFRKSRKSFKQSFLDFIRFKTWTYEHRSLEFTSSIRKPEKLLEISNNDNNLIN